MRFTRGHPVQPGLLAESLRRHAGRTSSEAARQVTNVTIDTIPSERKTVNGWML